MNSVHKPTHKRGAQRAQASFKQKLLAAMPRWHFSLTKLLFLCFITMACITTYGGLRAVDSVLNVPVEEIKVSGDLLYQDKQAVEGIISQYVDNGFVQVDIERLYQQLSALPWVYRLSIKRQLPNGLLITLEEQNAVAYWNDDAMLNNYGEVFRPEQRPDIAGMPVFSGNKPEQVIALYKQLQQHLAETQTPIRELHINRRNTVNVMLADQTILVMNLANIDQQLSHWRDIYQALDSAQINSIEKVDLRYSNGAAVQWKKHVASIAGNKRGGHY